jgi:hypothetical protein
MKNSDRILPKTNSARSSGHLSDVHSVNVTGAVWLKPTDYSEVCVRRISICKTGGYPALSVFT